MITTDEHGCTTITGTEDMALYRLMSLQSGLKLEAAGMRISRGVSCLAIAKRDYGCKGGRAAIVEQVDALVANAKAARRGAS